MQRRPTPDATPADQAGTATPPLHALEGEQLLTLPRAARTLPGRDGPQTNTSTIWRWAAKGVKVPGGQRIKLESVRVGGVAYTSREALARFFAKLAAARGDAGDDQAATPTRTDRRRERAAEASGRRLTKLGI